MQMSMLFNMGNMPFSSIMSLMIYWCIMIILLGKFCNKCHASRDAQQIWINIVPPRMGSATAYSYGSIDSKCSSADERTGPANACKELRHSVSPTRP